MSSDVNVMLGPAKDCQVPDLPLWPLDVSVDRNNSNKPSADITDITTP